MSLIILRRLLNRLAERYRGGDKIFGLKLLEPGVKRVILPKCSRNKERDDQDRNAEKFFHII